MEEERREIQIEHHEHAVARKGESHGIDWCALCDGMLEEDQPRFGCARCGRFLCCEACTRRPLGKVAVPTHPHPLSKCSTITGEGQFDWKCSSGPRCRRPAHSPAIRLRCAV